MTSKLVRSMAVAASAAIILGAFVAAPAEAKKKKPKPPSCPAATFAEPASPSASRPTDEDKLITVTDAATEEAPLVVEYDHGQAVWDTANQKPIVEDTKWFPLQVDSADPVKGLFIRLEWATPSVSDFDLYLWDGASGEQADVSGAINQFPVNAPFVADTGAMGYEQISGFAAGDCLSYLIESRAFLTNGEHITMSIWLGEPAA